VTRCCIERTTSVQTARDRRFSPLDHKLRLREDSFSDGAARVAARQGLEAKSFDRAAASYREAVGAPISADSVARITEGFGRLADAKRERESEIVGEVARHGEMPKTERIETCDPITAEQANISTDGMMVRIRGDGWKEARATVISKVEIKPAQERKPAKKSKPSRRDDDPLVKLSEHSYQVGLFDVEILGKRQYAEAVRRGIADIAKLSSVNDAAVYIGKVTELNFPQAVQIVDWTHAAEHLWAVGRAVYGEGSDLVRVWVERQLDCLWNGRVADVVVVLDGMDLTNERYPDEVRRAPGYFRNNQDRMRYHEYRAAGYPIGSGTVESSANNVVHDRMKRPGRGWLRDNAHSMLSALAELHSNRFHTVWLPTQQAAA
jgi:hypothetical protein